MGKLLIDLLFLSTRIETIGFDRVRAILRSRNYILAFWHSRILLVGHQFKGSGGIALVSSSDDGEIIARILECQGQQTVRGSTTRGGLRALAQLIKQMKSLGKPGAMVPDGPQGPRFMVQPGVVILAQKTGYPIIPITYSARKLKVFASWDRFIFPYPFTHCRFVYGQPVHVAPKADKTEQEASRRELENELNRITLEADAYFKHKI